MYERSEMNSITCAATLSSAYKRVIDINYLLSLSQNTKFYIFFSISGENG